VALALTGVLVFVGSAAVAVYARLQANVDGVNVDAYLGTDRPTRPPAQDPTDAFAGRDLNILVMGTDIRDGENASIGGVVDGMRSDSTFVVHIFGDRSRIDVISVPRDSLVAIPACRLPDGSMSRPRSSDMFNSAFLTGGGPTEDLATAAACTRRTFEKLTGVRTDEHVVIKMDGVKAVIDTLGGVPMCVPEAMRSPEAGLDVPAGRQVFDGQTSIAFLRARTGTGNGLEIGSDLGRIGSQQQFIKAAIAQVQSRHLLTDPATVMAVLDKATRSLSVSSGLAGLTSVAGLAFSLRNTSQLTVTTMTVPVAPAPSDPKNRVVWAPAAQALWAHVAADEPLTGQASTGAPQGSAPSTAPGAPVGTGAASPSSTVQPDVGADAQTGTCG
jgi:LCP family protein required for cell wall assembly